MRHLSLLSYFILSKKRLEFSPIKFVFILYIICYSGGSIAEGEIWLLNNGQYESLLQYKNFQKDTTSSYYKKPTSFIHDNPIFSKVAPEAGVFVFELLKDTIPSDSVATQQQKVCLQIARAILSDKSENILVEVVNKAGAGKPLYFNKNIVNYFYTQTYNFYKDNNAIGYLDNAEYVSLLKPQPILKLLKEIKGEERLRQELFFIIKNSSYDLYK